MTDKQAQTQPIYWFVVLEDAIDRGDLQAAANAQRELRRLGVRVAYDSLQLRGQKEANEKHQSS